MDNKIINADGEIFVKLNAGDVVTTQEQRDAVRQYYRGKGIDYEVKAYHDERGGFYVAFHKLIELHRTENELTRNDIARLFYMATFIDKEGRLQYDGNHKPIKKLGLRTELEMSRNKFAEFYKKITALNILEERSDGLYMSRNYFQIYVIDKSKVFEYSRINKDTIRYLYKGVKSTSIKHLGAVFCLLERINLSYNVVCHNPLEEQQNRIDPIYMDELAEILGYSKPRDLKAALRSIEMKDGTNLVGFFEVGNSSSIVINPNLLYSGRKWDDLRLIAGLFEANKNKKKGRR